MKNYIFILFILLFAQVKSRWRRNSEAEAIGADTSTPPVSGTTVPVSPFGKQLNTSLVSSPVPSPTTESRETRRTRSMTNSGDQKSMEVVPHQVKSLFILLYCCKK